GEGVSLLDRYIFRAVLGTTFGAVCLFAFVLMAGNILRELIGPVLSGQMGLLTFGRLVLLTIPVVLMYALPASMLTGVLITLGRLSSDNEVTAMRAAGLSILRIALPVLVLAGLGALLALRVNFQSMPWAKLEYEREFSSAIKANPLSFIRPKTFIREFPGYVIYVGSMNGADVRDFWLWQLDPEKRVIRSVRAESGRVDYDGASNEFIITLERGYEEDHDRNAPDDFTIPMRISSFGQIEPFRLSMSRYYGSQTVHQKLQWMTYDELSAERIRLMAEPVAPGGEKQHAISVMKVTLTIQDKVNLALAVFSFAFIGVPLGIKVSRRETSANLGLAVVLALTYYFLVVVVGWLDHHPDYRPDLLMWVPNLIFLGLGALLLRRLDRA
ncbi:MAG TPA: LptF/LptG family permease, partial [Opitutaceae bacterium]